MVDQHVVQLHGAVHRAAFTAAAGSHWPRISNTDALGIMCLQQGPLVASGRLASRHLVYGVTEA